ncbi:MAG: histidine phosphatase family protein [Clostridia bacterium]|nr:histidine phosphatase family protein [Clostridia bacterium]
MKSYVIHFIRSGLTQANEEGIYAGTTEYELSERGKEALYSLKERYTYPEAPILYSSPMKSCINTAKIIYPDKTPIIIDQIRECSFGDWEGKSYKEIENDPEYYSWIRNRENTTPPNGESGKEFTKRVCTAFDLIVTGMMKTGNTEAIMVTHGGVIVTLLCALAYPKAEFYDWIVDNGCGYSVRIIPSLWMRGRVMEVFDKVPKEKD